MKLYYKNAYGRDVNGDGWVEITDELIKECCETTPQYSIPKDSELEEHEFYERYRYVLFKEHNENVCCVDEEVAYTVLGYEKKLKLIYNKSQK